MADDAVVEYSWDMPEYARHRPTTRCLGCCLSMADDMARWAEGINDDDPLMSHALAAFAGFHADTYCVAHGNLAEALMEQSFMTSDDM